MDGLLLEPMLILNDEDFLAMDDRARLAYLVLLMNLWLAKEPGVAPAVPRVLAAMAWVSVEEWEGGIGAQVAPALDTTTRPGHWVSPIMVARHREQIEWREGQRRAGSMGGKAKRRNRMKRASSDPTRLPLASRSRSRSRRKTVLGAPMSAIHESGVGALPSVGGELFAGSPSPPAPAFMRLPTNKPGETYTVTAGDVAHLRALYPAVDIEQEVRSMRGWLDSHRSERKTLGGMPAFIDRWLKREQNRGTPAEGRTHHRAGADARAAAGVDLNGPVVGRVPARGAKERTER